MDPFTVRTADQLPVLLQAFRKQAGMTQKEVALRLGVTQQTYSALERNADSIGMARLLKLLGIWGVELALNRPGHSTEQGAEPSPLQTPKTPTW